jgi:hypothetical protein
MPVPARPIQPPKGPAPRGKARIVALALALGSLLTLLIVLYIAQSRYEAVLRAPRIRHETYATGNTRLKVVVKPPLAQRRIAAMLLPGRSLPDWFLGMTVPEETALLIDPDLENNRVKVRMFINYARLGPVIRDALNQSGVTRTVPGVEWEPPEIVEKERGVLLLEGISAVSPETVQGALDRWAGAQAFPPPAIEGTHAFEAALENRDGKGYVALAGLAEMSGQANPSLEAVLNPKSLYLVASLRSFADFVNDDTLKVVLIIDGNPSAGANVGQQLKTFLDLAMGLAKGELRKQYGVTMEGASTVEGLTVRGEYTLTGIDALLAPVPAP